MQFLVVGYVRLMSGVSWEPKARACLALLLDQPIETFF